MLVSKAVEEVDTIPIIELLIKRKEVVIADPGPENISEIISSTFFIYTIIVLPIIVIMKFKVILKKFHKRVSLFDFLGF